MTTLHLEVDKSDPLHNISRFEIFSSGVGLIAPKPESEYGYVGISFAFQTLSLQIVQFDTAYTLNNLFGDFA